MAALCCVLAMAAVAVGEARHAAWAFDAEEMVLAGRSSALAAALCAGLFAAAWREEIAKLGGRAKRVVSSEGSPSPWPVQAILLLLAIAGVVLIARPGLVDKITSFKAGEVEAHFSESASAIQKAPVNFLDVSYRSSLSNWTDFRYRAQGDGGANYRSLTYEAAGAKMWKLDVADIVFNEQLRPFFEYIDCFERKGRIDIVQNERHFADFAYGFAAIIREGFAADPPSPVAQIERYAANFEQAVEAEAMWKQRAAELSCAPIAAAGDMEDVRRQLDRAVDIVDDMGAAADDPIWDPTIEAAVADMIGYVKDQRGRADLLQAAVGALRTRHAECAGPCIVPVYGRLNLLYEAVDAKIRSQQPWPLDDLVDDIAEAIGGLDRLANSRTLHEAATRKGAGGEALWQETQRLYRRNRLFDLALGLEVYYQRALAGEILSPRHRSQWQAWIEETRHILAITERVGLAQVGFMDREEVGAWKDAQEEIEKDPVALEDAATSVALSLVLLPRQTAAPSAEACAAAKGMADFGANDVLHRLSNEKDLLAEGDRATYKGFLGQVQSRVEAECS